MAPFSSTTTAATGIEPTTLGQATVDEQLPLELGDAKWIGLQKLKWTDQDGKHRVWEVAHRKTTNESGVDAVAIVAILRHPKRPTSIPIILQYRPPIAAVCVELPAGLIDKGETAETAALRELHEETGYGGAPFEGRINIVEKGGVVPSDPGMTRANMHLVTIEVELKEDEQEPKAKLEPGEHIEVRTTPINELYSHLLAYEKLGYVVDARLHHYAAGIELAKRLKL